jgi:hypothetical protein
MVTQFDEERRGLWEMAKANLEKAHKRYKDFADKSRQEVNFEEGDEMWLNIKNFRLPEGLSHKFLGPYVGPFKVLEKKLFDTYKLELPVKVTSYGQKKGRESICQFDSRPQKVGNRPDLLSYKGHATYRWKVLDESYNFTLDHTSIGGLVAKLWGSKVARIPVGEISGLPLGSPGKEKPFECRPHGQP